MRSPVRCKRFLTGELEEKLLRLFYIAKLQRFANSRLTVIHLEFIEDILHMKLHGARTHIGQQRNFVIRLANTGP